MFIMCVAVGIALTLSYDLLRVFRRVVSHNSILIAMEDVCFWLIWTYVTLECIHVYGDGVLHWYMAVCIFVWRCIVPLHYKLYLVKICKQHLVQGKKIREKAQEIVEK